MSTIPTTEVAGSDITETHVFFVYPTPGPAAKFLDGTAKLLFPIHPRVFNVHFALYELFQRAFEKVKETTARV